MAFRSSLARLFAVFAFALWLSACDLNPGNGTAPAAAGVALSGAISASGASIQDTDVNDPQAPYLSNDSPARAQSLPNPVTVGGYLNIPGQGPSGDSQQPGDSIDVYRLILSEGQTITLSFSEDAKTTDLDLLLINDKMQIIDASLGTGNTETLTVGAQVLKGGYYVAIVVCGSTLYSCDPLPKDYVGAGNYILHIGEATALSMDSHNPQLQQEFMPGELVVSFESPYAQAITRPLGYRARRADAGRPTLIHVDPETRARVLTEGSKQRASTHVLRAGAELQAKLDTLFALKTLRRSKGVISADLNYLRRPLLNPNDPMYRHQWHYPMIKLPQAWDLSTGARSDGQDVVVAVIDTGILPAHPDLQGRLVPGYDFIDAADNARDGDGLDSDPSDPGDKLFNGRSSFHGTHVAGTIAAAGNNGIGGAGVAWNAKIMPLRVLGQFGGTSYDVQQAVLYAAGLANDSGTQPARRADVINLSLGGGGYSETEQAAFRSARGAGVIIVAAAGNNASDTPSYPAAYNGVLSVSAVDAKQALSAYSNYGATIDIAAPGGNVQVDANQDGNVDGVLSTSANDSSGSIVYTYGFMNGTSMATPHVAGVAALMKAVRPSLTPKDFDALLAGGALTQDLGAPGRDDDFGYGLVDAYKAVLAASSGIIPTTPLLIAAPGRLEFDTTHSTLTLTIANGGGGTLVAQEALANAAWLTLTPHLDEDGLGHYSVMVNRAGLKPGTYTASISVTSSANRLEIPVAMQVSEISAAGGMGYQWIVLVDTQTQQTRATLSVRANGDKYEFNMEGIAPGTYYVFAGTDLDNDQYICDADEACGAYGSLNQPTPLKVGDQDINELVFTAGFKPSTEVSSSTEFTVPKGGLLRVVKSSGE